MSSKFSKKYEGEWSISTPATPTEFKNIATPSFLPLPDCNLAFCFEAWYQEVFDGDNYLYLFKLKLVKLSSFSAYPTLEVSLSVKVYYSDKSLFAEYLKLPSYNVDKMNEVTFKDIVQNKYARGRSANNIDARLAHISKMASNTLIIKCTMTFSGQHQTLDVTPANDIKFTKYLDLAKNLKSVYEPSVLSDFTFQVGDRSFPAHKVILAARSPVFMKMMTQEFMESKTNTATITDATPEIFDAFLRYLYSGEIGDNTWDSLKELYYLADKYDVGFLKAVCTSRAISLNSIDLVCDILKLAYRYSNLAIKKAAISFAVKNIKKLVSRDDWKELVNSEPLIGYEVTVNFIPK